MQLRETNGVLQLQIPLAHTKLIEAPRFSAWSVQFASGSIEFADVRGRSLL